jgi:hypothetical protein
MFGFGTGKRPTTGSSRAKLVGVNLTASHLRALVAAGGHTRAVTLDWPNDDLPLFLSLEKRAPEVGLSAWAICRKMPHLVCSNFLPQLGQAREWRNGRSVLTPETAWQAVCEKVRSPLTAESDGLALTLPAYLAAAQVKSLVEIAAKAKLPIRGTASAALAVTAHRASAVLLPKGEAAKEVLKIRPRSGGAGIVVFVDADEYALSAAIVTVDPHEVRLLGAAAWPKLSRKLWNDRLIDGVADRCVRLCRRDLRDSAAAEQALFEQLDAALERIRGGQSITLTIRTDKWYQDVPQQPSDFEAHCANLASAAATAIRELIATANVPLPPVAVWLTDSAAKLPGLANVLYRNSAEQTEVAVLPGEAVTEAAAALHSRWITSELPNVHLDGVIPLEPVAKPEPRATAKRS